MLPKQIFKAIFCLYALPRLDANPAVVSAWDRLYQGDYIKNDISFLKHEYAESLLMEKTNIYKPYHDAVDKVGLDWKRPPQYRK